MEEIDLCFNNYCLITSYVCFQRQTWQYMWKLTIEFYYLNQVKNSEFYIMFKAWNKWYAVTIIIKHTTNLSFRPFFFYSVHTVYKPEENHDFVKQAHRI